MGKETGKRRWGMERQRKKGENETSSKKWGKTKEK